MTGLDGQSVTLELKFSNATSFGEDRWLGSTLAPNER